MSSIFISHAIADKHLVDRFFDLLQTGCSLAQNNIDCTSVEGAGIKTGNEFIVWIKDHLKTSDLVILIVTPNYFASKFCMAEMGAAWATDRQVFPIILENLPRYICVVMLGRQTALLNNPGLDELRDQIVKLFPETNSNTPRWNIKKEKFLSDITEILSNLPLPQQVSKQELDAEKAKNLEAIRIISELENQNKKMQEQISALEQIKDQSEVGKVKQKFMKSDEIYWELLQIASDELNGFSQVEIRCIYAFHTANWWYPSVDAWNDYRAHIARAVQSSWILEKLDDADQSTYMLDGENPRYQKALCALEKLNNYITEKLDRKTKKMLEERIGYYIDLNNLEFWGSSFGRGPLPE